jgi:hypothetical protein
LAEAGAGADVSPGVLVKVELENFLPEVTVAQLMMAEGEGEVYLELEEMAVRVEHLQIPAIQPEPIRELGAEVGGPTPMV